MQPNPSPPDPPTPTFASLPPQPLPDLSCTRHSNWRDTNMPSICHHMTEWPITALWLSDNNQQQIITQISRIDFKWLIRIDLMNNSITTIELLWYCNMPSLTELYLQDNHITSVQALRKTHFPSLHFVGLGGNKFRDWRGAGEWGCGGLGWLGVAHEDGDGGAEGVGWVAGCESRGLVQLQLENSRKIKQPRVYAALASKYPGLDIALR